MRETPKGWNEFWAEFWRIRHLRTLKGIDRWNQQVVDHIVAVLDLKPGDCVLDLACGSGEHACELARRGMAATGIDIADVLVRHARETARREGLSAEFRLGDMRTLPFENEFDACTLLSGSFGFFDDETNLEVLRQITKALKSNGKVYIQVTPPPERAFTRRTWDRVDGGYVLMEDIYDAETRRRGGSFMYVDPDGELITFAPQADGTSVSDSMKLYTLDEYKSMFAAAGLEYTAAYGSVSLPPATYVEGSPELIAVAASGRDL